MNRWRWTAYGCRSFRARSVIYFAVPALGGAAVFPAGPDATTVGMAKRRPEAEAGDRAELARVAQAMSNLPHKLHQVLVLRAVEGLTQAEAAEALGVTEKAVETRLYRARQQLAQMLEAKV